MTTSQFSFRNSSYHNSPIISQLPECSRLLSEYCFSVSSLQAYTVLSPPYLSLALTPLAYRMVPSNSSYLPSHIHSLCNQSTLGVLLCISYLCICPPLFKTAFNVSFQVLPARLNIAAGRSRSCLPKFVEKMQFSNRKENL